MKLTPHLRFLFRNLHNPDSEPSLDWFAMRLEKQGIFLNNHLFFFHQFKLRIFFQKPLHIPLILFSVYRTGTI